MIMIVILLMLMFCLLVFTPNKMMRNVQYIDKQKFYKKFNVQEVDLVKRGLFTNTDLDELKSFEENKALFGKLLLFFSYLGFIFKNPEFVNKFIFPRILKRSSGKYLQNSSKLKYKQPIYNYIILSSIASAFKPKRILEIGTYLGWGAASFKTIDHKIDVYTINPSVDNTSNNTITKKDVGSFAKKRKLKIKQIWADSTKYNFNKILPVDITFIDGNHQFSYVLKDLENSSKVTKKCIILDDYIPKNEAKNYGLIYGPWNEGVINAVDKFLINNPDTFKNSFWIKGTPYCVLLK